MKPGRCAVSWCVRHEPDYDGWIRHTVDIGSTVLTDPPAVLPVRIERADAAPDQPGTPYLWLPYGEGVALYTDQALSHIRRLFTGYQLLTADQGRVAA